MLQIECVSENIEQPLQNGIRPVIVTPRNDHETWWVLKEPVTKQDAEWSMWKSGTRVLVPLTSYCVPRNQQVMGAITLNHLLCAAAVKKHSERGVHKNPRVVVVIGETDYQPEPPPEGYERLWLGLTFVDSPQYE